MRLLTARGRKGRREGEREEERRGRGRGGWCGQRASRYSLQGPGCLWTKVLSPSVHPFLV